MLDISELRRSPFMSYESDQGDWHDIMIRRYLLGFAGSFRRTGVSASARRAVFAANWRRLHELASGAELTAMEQAWLEWSELAAAYAAFAWCRALGWKAAANAEPRLSVV